jgi:hypothetical protein
MLLESINKRLAVLQQKQSAMNPQPTSPTETIATSTPEKTTPAVDTSGAKTIGIKVDPTLYARIQNFKERYKIRSMKKAVLVLCKTALDDHL